MGELLQNLNHKQREQLIQLRTSLGDVLQREHDDLYLRRFLVATEFHTSNAETMFRKHLEWRAKNNMDSVIEHFRPSEVCERYWVGGFLDGYDKDGYPIWIIPVGTCDPKGLLYSCKTSELITYMLVLLERASRNNKRRCKQLGNEIDWGATLILDLENLGIRHLWKPFVNTVTEFLSITERNYPETAKKVFVINAPAIFPLAYSVIRPFLPAYTREKVQVLGSSWKEDLLQYIDPDVLPVYWGGTKMDPDGDPKCSSMVKPGGQVDTCYYKNDVSLDQREFITVQVAAGTKHKITQEIKTSGVLLRYQFKTCAHDIGFHIQYIDNAEKKTDIRENRRYNSHLVPEDGEIVIDKAGTYMLVFDNSYSWTKSKTLSYWLETLESTDDLEEIVEH